MRNNRLTRSPRAPTGASPNAPRYDGIYIGVIKDNADASNMGRLRVWIPEFFSVQNEEAGWITVNYCSPFAGATSHFGNGNEVSDFNQTQTSYGFWMIPPDVDNLVSVFFVGGNPSNGYWFGCMYQHNMNHMVPATSASSSFHANGIPTKYHDLELPVGEYNKRTTEANLKSPKRPVANHFFKSIAAQGLIRDKIRGISKLSVSKTSPSNIYGMSTPGPIIPKTKNRRHGGNQFFLSDVEGDEGIVLRTRSGCKIKLDNTNGMVYIINKDGSCWLEFSGDGNIDLFGKTSISMRSMGDFNIRADRDLNFEAGRNVNLTARNDWSGDGTITADGVGGGQISVASKDILLSSTGNTELKHRNLHVFASNSCHFESKTLILNNNQTIIDSTDSINLNTTVLAAISSNTIDFSATTVNINMSVLSAAPIPAIPRLQTSLVFNTKTNILESFTDEWLIDRNSQEITTINSRFITFEPCPEHKT